MIEPLCLAIVLTYLIVRARRDPDPRAFLARIGVLAVSSFLAENSIIHAYGFYAYAAGSWTVFLDRVPVMIVLIWPVVISSAEDLAGRLAPPREGLLRNALLGAAIVLFDASLIEPIAVRAGLWSWTEPGLFAVPPIGILGWAYFALLAMIARGTTPLFTVAVSVLGTHALLLESWWVLFRWVNATIPALPVVILAWILSIALASYAWKKRLRERVPAIELYLRVPGAIFFFALLAVAGAERVLIAYACAFAPPYLALIDPAKTRKY